MKKTCKILIDTSIAWAVAEHRIQKALRSFFGQLKEKIKVCYTEYTLFEMRTTGFSGFRAKSILNSIATLVVTDMRIETAYRYKAVKRMGVNDVLIVLAAKKLGAILATGDWPQARFYMSQTGRKPIYIPLRALE